MTNLTITLGSDLLSGLCNDEARVRFLEIVTERFEGRATVTVNVDQLTNIDSAAAHEFDRLSEVMEVQRELRVAAWYFNAGYLAG